MNNNSNYLEKKKKFIVYSRLKRKDKIYARFKFVAFPIKQYNIMIIAGDHLFIA